MTIAAALRCEDGVILCADSLVSGGDVNDMQRKIVAFNATNLQANVAMAFAGSVPHCWNVIKTFARKLNAMPASEDLLDAEAFETALTDVLEAFYRKHIYSHPNYPYGTAPVVDLIAVLQHRKGGFASIFTTWETVVNQQAMYAFIGSGASFAKAHRRSPDHGFAGDHEAKARSSACRSHAAPDQALYSRCRRPKPVLLRGQWRRFLRTSAPTPAS